MKRLYNFLSGCLFLVACSGQETRNEDTTVVKDSVEIEATDQKPEVGNEQITGFIQSSGLRLEEKKKLGLTDSRFQLLSRESYFLEGTDSLQKFWGQCITLEGKVKEEWENNPEEINGQYTYGRKVFVVEEVVPQMFSYCQYTDSTENKNNNSLNTFFGRVARMERPAPDIAYDYKLILDRPFKEPNHPVSPNMLVKEIPIFTSDFDVLGVLEESVQLSKAVSLKGTKVRGYAESIVLQVQESKLQE